VAKAAPDATRCSSATSPPIPSTRTPSPSSSRSKPSRDLVGIAKLVEIPHIIAVTAGFPGSTLADLVAEAKRNPGKIKLRLGGPRQLPHLDMEKLQKAAGIQMTHVPYKGGAGR